MSKREPLFKIQGKRRCLEFFRSWVKLYTKCYCAAGWRCTLSRDSDWILRRATVVRLLKLTTGEAFTANIGSGIYLASRPALRTFQVGCKTFKLSPKNYTRVRRWALQNNRRQIGTRVK